MNVWVSSSFENSERPRGNIHLGDRVLCGSSVIQIFVCELLQHLPIKLYLLVPQQEMSVFSAVFKLYLQIPATYIQQPV